MKIYSDRLIILEMSASEAGYLLAELDFIDIPNQPKPIQDLYANLALELKQEYKKI